MVKKDNKKSKSGLFTKIIIWAMVFMMSFSAIAALIGALL